MNSTHNDISVRKGLDTLVPNSRISNVHGNITVGSMKVDSRIYLIGEALNGMLQNPNINPDTPMEEIAQNAVDLANAAMKAEGRLATLRRYLKNV